jgi:capsular exopolysaccharide synthesis family protein
MSRFFEALWEASRSQPVPTGILENGQSVPANDLNEPEIETGAPVETGGGAPTGLLDMFEAFAEPPVSSFEAKTINARLDPKAPLLPHSVDQTIVEHYRRLRTKIQQQQAVQPIRSLMVASPLPGEGKTTTALNLALSFGMLPSFKVLVVEGDLRKSAIGNWLRLQNMPGLSNIIDGSAQPQDVILQSGTLPIHFVLSGTADKPSTELLHSPVLGDFMRRATQQFDLVLVDSPPVNLLADAQLLAQHCEGILLVARAFSTSSKAFQKAMQDLISFRIVGTVLNAGMRSNSYQHYYKS